MIRMSGQAVKVAGFALHTAQASGAAICSRDSKFNPHALAGKDFGRYISRGSETDNQITTGSAKMSEPGTSGGNIRPQETPSEAEERREAAEEAEHIYLVAYPKIIFLYPTVVAALFCAIVMWARGEPAADSTFQFTVARVFLVVLSLNLVVLAFDFPRGTSLTWFFAAVALGIGLWSLFHLNPTLLPHVSALIASIKPQANAMFYMIFTISMLTLYGIVLISRRFDYWEVRGNELLHHSGLLSDLKRFSAPNLRIDKEINDVFEYLLLRSGRLIIHSSNERRAIVLDNVLFINGKEERITKMLGALQVRVRTDAS